MRVLLSVVLKLVCDFGLVMWSTFSVKKAVFSHLERCPVPIIKASDGPTILL
jgi:hypothetical protein